MIRSDLAFRPCASCVQLLVVDSLVSARTASPGGGRKRSQGDESGRTGGAQSAQEPAPLDDEVAF